MEVKRIGHVGRFWFKKRLRRFAISEDAVSFLFNDANGANPRFFYARPRDMRGRTGQMSSHTTSGSSRLPVENLQQARVLRGRLRFGLVKDEMARKKRIDGVRIFILQLRPCRVTLHVTKRDPHQHDYSRQTPLLKSAGNVILTCQLCNTSFNFGSVFMFLLSVIIFRSYSGRQLSPPGARVLVIYFLTFCCKRPAEPCRSGISSMC